MTAPRPIRIAMTYRPTGERLVWRIWREPHGWVFTDHEDYARFAAENWTEAVERLKSVADNHNMDAHIS